MKYSLADGLKGADGGDDFDFGIYKVGSLYRTSTSSPESR